MAVAPAGDPELAVLQEWEDADAVVKQELHLRFAVAHVDAETEVVRDDQVRRDLGQRDGSTDEHGGFSCGPGLVDGTEGDRMRLNCEETQGQ